MPPSEGTTRVAVYERVIAASLSRIWENVLDWEHLPWLHRTSFGAVRLLEESPGGWRAWIATRPRAEESLIEVVLDRPALRYVSRTTDGAGAGSEVWTALEPLGDRTTKIRVEFEVPAMDPALVVKIGEAYVRLYRRLWDEDEAMMMRRQRLIDEQTGRADSSNPGGFEVPLGSIEDLRRRLPLRLRVGGRELRLVAVDGDILAHPTVCPHLGGPLDDAVVENGCITCPWHGYRYDLRSGRSADGHALSLAASGQVRISENGLATLNRNTQSQQSSG